MVGIFSSGTEIAFAHTSFKWANLASHNAGVTVVIVGISNHAGRTRQLFSDINNAGTVVKTVDHINAYLVAAPNVIVTQLSRPLCALEEMSFGNMPNDGGSLLLDIDEAAEAIRGHSVQSQFIRPFLGSQEFISGEERRCIWIEESHHEAANRNAWLRSRFEAVKAKRIASSRATTAKLANIPYRFGEVRQIGTETVMIVPSVSSETREYLPVGYLSPGAIVSNLAFALFNAPLWNMALIA